MVSPKVLVSHRPGVQTYRKRQYSPEPVSLACCGACVLHRVLGNVPQGSALRRSGAAGDFERCRAHLLMDEAVGGEDNRAAEVIGLAFEVADSAARFFDEQHSRSGVPLVQAEFPKAVEATCRDAGEIERGGAITAHAVRALRELAVILKIRAGLAIPHGKTGTEEAGGECGDFGDVNFLAVEGGGFAARGGEEFLVKGVEDDRGEKRVSLGEGDGNAEAGVAVGEIGGAVERIHVPAKLRSRSAFVTRSFFGGNGVLREILGEPRNDGLLGALVGLRDQIHLIALVADVHRPGKFFDQDLPGFLGDFDGGFQIGSGHGKDVRCKRSKSEGRRRMIRGEP